EERHRFFREEQAARDSAALAAALKTVAATPIPIKEDARWLPKSDLQNPGFWRRWDISEILPITLPTDTRLTAVLARRSGDIVVGTSRGICVMRRGWWEWYGYDETASRFSADLPPSALKASSEVLSLAESADGATLWVGTANGLIELHQATAAIPDLPYGDFEVDEDGEVREIDRSALDRV